LRHATAIAANNRTIAGSTVRCNRPIAKGRVIGSDSDISDERITPQIAWASIAWRSRGPSMVGSIQSRMNISAPAVSAAKLISDAAICHANGNGNNSGISPVRVAA
jgi:hypothetical protein